MRQVKTTTSENKSLKTLKGQLFGAVSMMLVAAIALGTSTYAWFINNRTVEVQKMDLTVSTSTSLLVNLQKQNLTGWTGYKSLLTIDDIIGTSTEQGGWTNFLNNKMVPASITSENLAAPTPTFFVSANNHVVDGKLDQFTELAISGTDSGVGQGPVKKLGLKFKSSADLTVYFGKADLTNIANLIVTKDDAPPIGTVTAADQAVAIRRALRVAIVPQKTTQITTDVVPVVFQFDKGESQTIQGNNTKYAGVAPATTADEPNGVYAAIKSVDSGTKLVTADDVLTALVPGHATPATNANNTLATVGTSGASATVTAPAANGIKLFDLKAEEERAVDVYIWLEGTDKDCLNQLSAYQFGLILPFAGADTTP